MFSRAGYDTALCGKWHLGYEAKFAPKHHGFQHSFGVMGGNADYFRHTEQDGAHVLFENGKPAHRKGYVTDLIADEAIQWLRGRKRPFFLYLPFTAPHSPYQGPDDEGKPAPEKGSRQTYVRMIERMDQRIGDVLEALKKDAGNTIVIFTSDNGGTGVGRNAPWRGAKGQLWEGGIRVPCLIRWPGHIAGGTTRDDVALTMDLTATVLAAAGARATRPLDGVDLMKPARAERTVFWRFKRMKNRRTAVREGNWKLVVDNGVESLHDLGADPGEKTNLARQSPERVTRMKKMIAEWERETAAARLKEFSAG